MRRRLHCAHQAGRPLRLACIGLLFAAGGCQSTPPPILTGADANLVWPPPPLAARIRYLGEISSSADLRAPRKPFQALGELFVGRAQPQRLYGPRAAACTADGERLWVADAGGRCLHLFDLRKRSYTKIERLSGLPLLMPVGLCLGPPGSIYVCDADALAVHRLSDRDGALLETLRLPEEIIRPVAVSWDPTSGALYVVDVKGNRIAALGADGRLQKLLGQRGAGAGEFNFPCDIADDGDVLWIVEAGNARVQGVDRTGSSVAFIGRSGDAPGDLALPKAVALDSDSQLYVVDARFENVQVFDRHGRLLLFFGQEGTDPGEFWLPSDIFIDGEDRIWICDTYNGRVQVFQYLKEQP